MSDGMMRQKLEGELYRRLGEYTIKTEEMQRTINELEERARILVEEGDRDKMVLRGEVNELRADLVAVRAELAKEQRDHEETASRLSSRLLGVEAMHAAAFLGVGGLKHLADGWPGSHDRDMEFTRRIAHARLLDVTTISAALTGRSRAPTQRELIGVKTWLVKSNGAMRLLRSEDVVAGEGAAAAWWWPLDDQDRGSVIFVSPADERLDPVGAPG